MAWKCRDSSWDTHIQCSRVVTGAAAEEETLKMEQKKKFVDYDSPTKFGPSCPSPTHIVFTYQQLLMVVEGSMALGMQAKEPARIDNSAREHFLVFEWLHRVVAGSPSHQLRAGRVSGWLTNERECASCFRCTDIFYSPN